MSGETVTLTVKPDAGYKLTEGSLSAIYESTPLELTPGAGNTYTFTMPAGDVTVTAAFASGTPIAVPTAVTGLTCDGTVQTGVEAGEGYTLTGNTSKNAGTHTAIATLDSGYKWADGSTAPKEISWTIAPQSTGKVMGRQGKLYGEEVSATVGRTIIPLTQEELESIDSKLYITGCDGDKEFVRLIDCAVPPSPQGEGFRSKDGFPRQCAHWLGMTDFL